MGKYVFFRLVNYVLLLIIAINLAYFLAATQLNPRILYEIRNPPIPLESINGTLNDYNLNDETPLVQRWWRWLTGVLHWDWGKTPQGGSVNTEVGDRIWVSLRLIIGGSVIGLVVGVLAGVWSAVRQYKLPDRVMTVISLVLIATPSFVIATFMVLGATKFNQLIGFQFFEFTGETGQHGDYFGAAFVDRLQHLMIPTAALVFFGFAGYSRVQRNLMLDTLGADFVRTARAKGLRFSTAVLKHALRTALIPIATYFAFSISGLFMGSATMEIVFSFRGMGIYSVEAINQQDVHGVVATTAFGGVCVLAGAFLSDILVAILDPRVRLS